MICQTLGRTLPKAPWAGNIHGFDEGKEGTLNIVWDVSMENHYAVLVFSMASYFSMITQTFILVWAVGILLINTTYLVN